MTSWLRFRGRIRASRSRVERSRTEVPGSYRPLLGYQLREYSSPTLYGACELMASRGDLPQDVIGLIDGRWTLAVLAELQDGGRRYQELDDALDGVSHKVLTDTLRRLERDGLVARLLDPSRVDTATLYQLTDLGRSLAEPLTTLERWRQINWLNVEAARRRWSRRSD